jgi:hypothetical protein
MEYKNIKTGFVLNTPCKIAGANWVEVNSKKENQVQVEKPQEQKAIVEKKQVPGKLPFGKTGDDEFDSITVTEIKQELDAQGIEYDPKAKKQELYDLMMGE